MVRRPRRRVDWDVIEGAEPSRPRLLSPSNQATQMAQLTSALLIDPSGETIDRVLRKTVELVRTVMRLERVAIYLVAPGGRAMVGTWGTDICGHTTDEHDLMYLVNDMVEDFFARASRGYAWSVYEDCPHVSHENGCTRTVGRGWTACTVIQGGGAPVGILFNDSAISGLPVDEGRQARVALLCALLGRAIEPCRAQLFDAQAPSVKSQHPLVRDALQLLACNPAQSFVDLAKQLKVSSGYLTRTFKRFADMSIVDYRNELRLAHVLSQIEDKPLKTAAVDAGFGSYVQFHRVFRARFGKTPRAYQLERRRLSDVRG